VFLVRVPPLTKPWAGVRGVGMLNTSPWALSSTSTLKEEDCIIANQLLLTLEGAFTLNIKLVLSENLGGILGGSQC